MKALFKYHLWHIYNLNATGSADIYMEPQKTAADTVKVKVPRHVMNVQLP